MKKGKLRIISASIVLCLVLAVSILSGCSLVTTNYAEYYKAIVASAETKDGKRIEITKKDLMVAYSTYGSQYVSYYGMSKEEAIKTTLKQLISTKLVVDKVENYLKKNNDGQILSAEEKTYLWEKTYDSLVNNLDSYKDKKDSDDETTTSSSISVDNYTKTATLTYDVETGEYTISKKEDAKTTIESYTFWSEGGKDASTVKGKEEIYTLLGDFVAGDSDYAKPYSKYIAELKRGEEGQNLSTSNKSVMLREIERVYNIVYEGYLTTRYEEIYKNSATNVTVNDVLELYKSKVLDDYTKYSIEKSSTYSEDIVQGAEDKYYQPTSNAEFFYVTHILIKFDDKTKGADGKTQQERFDYYNKILEEGEDGETTVSQAENGINALYQELRAMVREKNENGEFVEAENSKQNVTAETVLQEVNDALSVSDETLKAEKFYELMFKYTEDDSSTLNAKFNYVIGVDYTQNTYDDNGALVSDYTAYSNNFADSFVKEAISLYNHGNAKVGDHSVSLVKSSFGYHILMYGGKIENLCENVSLSMNLSADTLVKLDSTRLNVCRDYTYFDLLYDELVKDNFSSYQTNDVNYMIENLVEYNFYYNAYKDLL